jgi:hypothetical protein
MIKCTKGQKKMRTREKERENCTKSQEKMSNKGLCCGKEKRDANLKPVGYPSGRITYMSGRLLPCQHSARPCLSGRVA